MIDHKDDPVESIPSPEDVRRLLADAVRRSDLLRALLRLAHRKAAYDPVADSDDIRTAPSQKKGVNGGVKV